MYEDETAIRNWRCVCVCAHMCTCTSVFFMTSLQSQKAVKNGLLTGKGENHKEGKVKGYP